MTTAPTIPAGQIGLFDLPTKPKTKVCATCKRERPLNLFAYKGKDKTEREDTCSTCRFPVDFTSEGGPKIRKSRSDALLNAPLASAIDPQPAASWMKAGDTIQVFLNNELTGQVVIGVLQVVSVSNGEKLRKQKRYTALRNKFVARGFQLMEIRRSVAAPAIERTAREGRADGE